MSKSNATAPVRLQVYLARCGLGSRRGCEELIARGRVAINGTAVSRTGEKVTAADTVTVDGRKVMPSTAMVYIALHKPRGFICANSDPERRPLASELYAGAIKERLFHVGRLDFLSTGLILYTNDGNFSKLVSHPGAQIEKEYLVETGREVDDALMRGYAKGIRVGEIIYRCRSYVLRGPHSVLITLTEGKNREIRNVFASRNIRLKRVHRLRIGPVSLRALPPGHFRHLTRREVDWFLTHASHASQGRQQAAPTTRTHAAAGKEHGARAGGTTGAARRPAAPRRPKPTPKPTPKPGARPRWS